MEYLGSDLQHMHRHKHEKNGEFLASFPWKIFAGNFPVESFEWKVFSGKFSLESFPWKVFNRKFSYCLTGRSKRSPGRQKSVIKNVL
jgi:hypothetical protein